MNTRGATTLEVLAWVVGAAVGTVAWSYNTFITYREAGPRLERIEKKLDCALGAKGACGE